MSDQHFQISFTVPQSPYEVFTAITDVRHWWSENITGQTDQLNAEFFYSYKDVHSCTIRITELVPEKMVVWHILQNHFSFIEDQSEWVGNDMIFEITQTEGGTRLIFSQHGLIPRYECFEVCSDAWTSYINGSLKDLIQTGEGKPNTKEHDLNQELVEKWGLPAK